VFAAVKLWLAALDDVCGGSDSASVVALPPEMRNELVKLQYDQLQAQMPTLYPAVIVAVIIGALALPSSLSPIFRFVVPAMFVGTCVYWMGAWRHRKGRTIDAERAGHELHHTARMTMGFGFAIGLWSMTILLDTDGAGRSFVPVLIMTAATIAAHCMASIPRTAIIMIALTTLPTIILLLVSGNEGAMTMGVAVFITSLIHCRLMIQSYRQMVASLRISHQMYGQANSDDLTGLPNRRAFTAMFESEVAREGTAASFGIAMIDLDGFKQVNDEWGHAMGDAMLSAVAERFEHYRRRSDTVFRFGGDEFAVIFRDVTDDTEIDARATALLGGLAAIDEQGNVALRIGASLGYALYRRDGSNLTDLLAAADAALYRAKASGKGCVKKWQSETRAA
jgi:diguanylate cyclase